MKLLHPGDIPAEPAFPVFVDLDSSADPTAVEHARAVLQASSWPAIGVSRTGAPVRPQLAAVLASVITEGEGSSMSVHVSDANEAAEVLHSRIESAPTAARVLTDLLKLTETLGVRAGLVAESLAYSMLLDGAEFAAWRSANPRRKRVMPSGAAVKIARTQNRLELTLNRPLRHNAFDREVRDALVEALDVARYDDALHVHLRGAGPSFCSGGDLDEFGTARDLAMAHLFRLDQSVGWRLHQLAARTTAHLHGACIGAGIELPAFAGHVVARPGTRVQLPELGMGLVPGAGGTVSVSRRIGRWRTAWWVLSGAVLDERTSLAWGLIDELTD